MNTINSDEETVLHKLSRLKTTKSSDPDNIHPAFYMKVFELAHPLKYCMKPHTNWAVCLPLRTYAYDVTFWFLQLQMSSWLRVVVNICLNCSSFLHLSFICAIRPSIPFIHCILYDKSKCRYASKRCRGRPPIHYHIVSFGNAAEMILSNSYKIRILHVFYYTAVYFVFTWCVWWRFADVMR